MLVAILSGVLLLLQPRVVEAQSGVPNALSGGITFSGLPGPNLAPYNGSIEGEFAVTPASGSWYQATFYGSPSPSILIGPISGTPGPATLQITDGLGQFTFGGFYFSSNNGESTYDIQAFLGATLVYHETGSLTGSFEPFGFNLLSTANSSIPLDGLHIGITPGAGVTSINIDNLMVATVPEPGSALLLASALGGILAWRGARRAGFGR